MRAGALIAFEARQNSIVRVDADLRFLTGLSDTDAPTGRRDQTRITGIAQHGRDDGLIHEPFALACFLRRPLGECFEEALDFGERFKTWRGEAFERFSCNRSDGLIADEPRALIARALIEIADRWLGDEIALLDARRHLLNRLAATVYAFQFASRYNDDLVESSFGCVVELEVQTIRNRIISIERAAKPKVKFRVR